MKKIISLLGLILLLQDAWSQPRPVKLSNRIIIDTDCGIDDMRAISLILSQSEISVLAIVTSEGSLSPADGADKVRSLLHEFGKDSIPVACGNGLTGINPSWREFNKSIKWGSREEKQESDAKAADCLLRLLKNDNEKVSIVCLGPLTNICEATKKDASILFNIDRIIWYNESVKPLQGFNYECDKESAGSVLNSDVRIDVISNLDHENSLFDSSLAALCEQSGTQLARILYNVFKQPPAAEKLKENHFKLCDDLVALYMINPELFYINADIDKLNIRYLKDYDIGGIREAMSDLIKGTYVFQNNIVFNRFPAEREMFNYDIRPFVDSVIARYGFDEWKANILTSEFHGHLGVFSIVGAKMGIKAREIFDAGPDMLEVISYAGSKPPYSCLNDGIQVSTGATLGMGTIRLAKSRKNRPAAVFTFNGRAVMISLKEEYLKQVDADIAEGIAKFGLMDDGYWKLIRHNSLKYWIEWDRNKIFDIEEISIKK